MVNDPWQKARAQPKSFTMQQMATIEATVEQRVLASIQKTKTDIDMEIDDAPERIKDLEHKVAALQDSMQSVSGNVQQLQVHQQQMTSEFASQMQTLQNQVDQGQVEAQSLMDNRLNEHMERIEFLLQQDKRARTDTAKGGE